jgi:sec-independent protein translocase protein TatB
MLGSLGGPELILILVIALIVFGPRRLPEIGKSIGKMLGEFRRASNEFQRTIQDEVEADKLRAPAANTPAVAASAPTSTTDTTNAESAAPALEPLAAPPGTVAVGSAGDAQDPR